LRDVVRAASARLVAAGIGRSEASMDAVLLARQVLGWDLARVIAHEIDAPPDGFLAAFEPLLARRERREPTSSILERREFWGLDFEVGPDVLAPRPETELIVEEGLACLAGLPRGGLIVDVGTGSGCLAVCLASEFPGARVIATDVSPAALAIAGRNARRHGVDGRVEFRRTSILDGVSGPATAIVSNPPYIPAGEIDGLAPEVRDWEPRLALDGGPDGLDMVRALLAAAPGVLAPGGWLIMEFGYGQEQGVKNLVRESPLELAKIRLDLQQIPRTLVARAASA
jgi:release factor glutamine methyltransferase